MREGSCLIGEPLVPRPQNRSSIMPRIIRLNRHHIAFVDEADYPIVHSYIWSIDPRHYTIYAVNHSLGRLHTFLMKPPSGLDVLHKDGNGLNCTRENMEVGTRRQNIRSTMKPKSDIPYLGVARGRDAGTFITRLRLPDGRRPSFGTYRDPVEAAKAYDRAVLTHYGINHPRNFR